MTRVIECSGTNFDIGEIHGRLAKDRITAGLATYKSLFAESVSMTWDDATKYASKFLPALEIHAPHLLEEMRGISAGSGYTLGDILALNARSEIALTKPQRSDPPDGCTAFSRLHKGEQFLCQNWDWKQAQLGQIVVLRILTPKGTRIVTATEAGMVGKVGLNSFGVGVTLNALKTVQMDPACLPIHVALRLVLESTSIANAVKILTTSGVASAAHFLIAEPTQSLGLEVNPVRPFGVIEPKSGCVFHTNHCVSAELPDALTEIPWLADSAPRLSRIEELVTKISDTQFDFDTVFEVFKDELGYPNSINRQVDPIAATGICTVFNIMMNCARKDMRLSFGRPTEVVETLEFSLEGE